ncbi:ABC transporter substrate-binding protein [Rothia kristinae]
MTSQKRPLLAPLALLALLAAGALALAGCSGGGSSADSSASASTSASASAAPAPSALPSGMGSTAKDGEFPRTVKGFRGDVTIDAAPKKVVVISTGQMDDVLDLGVVPVGTTSAKNADAVPEYLTKAYADDAEALGKIESVGSRTSPNIEKIANLKPDLILVNNTLKDDSAYESLSGIAPTVVTEGTGVNWKQDYLLVASALGKQQEGEQKLAEYTERAKKVGEQAGSDKTISFLRYQPDRIRIWGVSSFVGSIAEDAGLSRPETQRFDKTSQDISAEQLDQADGNYLFYGVQGGDASDLTKETLWSGLEAVKSDHAFQVDDDEFYLNAGITAANGVLDEVEEHAK